MHEVSIISELVERLDAYLADQQVERAQSLRLRRGSTFSEEALLQSFEALSRGTRLEGAQLIVESVNTIFRCERCQHTQSIASDDLVGHMMVCPECAHVQEVDEAHELEVLQMTA